MIALAVFPVDVARQRVDFAVVGDEPVRMGQRPGRKRVRAEPLVHQRERRFHVRIEQVQFLAEVGVGAFGIHPVEYGELARDSQESA